MYFLLTDETNLQSSEDVKFFAYGGVFFRSELVPALDREIQEIRRRHGFKDAHELKFNTKSRPPGMDQTTHTRAKDEVLDLAIKSDCRFISYVVHHGIAKTQSADKRITFAADHILKGFHEFLVEVKDTGIVLVDPLPISKPDEYLRKKFQIGLDFPHLSKTQRLERIHLYGTTGVGMSNLSSVIDIVLGSFRYCINNPKSKSVASTLFKKVLQLMWHQNHGEKRIVSERGFLLRPKEIKSKSYKEDCDALIRSLKGFAAE